MATAAHTRRRHQATADGRPSGEAAPITRPDITNLAACVEDARRAGLDGDTGPEDPTQYHQLLGRLQAARPAFSPLYQQAVVDPYIRRMQMLGQDQFTQILIRDPDRSAEAGLMLDIAQAILQRGEAYMPQPSNAFQQVVADLYDGFLSAEDRRAVPQPTNATTPPVVKLGRPDFGPYTFPIDATRSFDLQCAIVNLPPSHARRALLGWAALAHETGGHDILHAYAGLQQELATAVRANLVNAGFDDQLSDYWTDRIDETAADVLGILNMGPAAAIGIIGYFRGLNAAFDGDARLRNEGPDGDPHPADIIRGYLGAATVGLLSFSQAAAWNDTLAQETDRDLTEIVLAGVPVNADDARKSATIVAETIVQNRCTALAGHSLGDIQDWRDQDDQIVAQVRPLLRTAGDLPRDQNPRIYAAHVVAAAVMEALANDGNVPMIFERMVAILDTMFDTNPIFGPLLVRSAGNLRRDMAYRRQPRMTM